jgi:spermidine/putrescine-binding protein
MYYLKTFSVGDAWVAVGWSSDVLPIAKRMSNVAVVVPKSGTSLWADLWVFSDSSHCVLDIHFSMFLGFKLKCHFQI